MVKVIGGKAFQAISSANAENNSIFLDSSDDILKTKDNSGSVAKIGDVAAFWLDSDRYDVYDDFESYSVGAFTSNTKWTASSTGSTISEVSGDKQINLQASYSGTSAGNTSETLFSETLSQNKHAFFDIFANLVFANNGGNNVVYTQVDIGDGTPITIFSNTIGGDFTNNSITFYTYSSLFIVSLGSNNYDVYLGGKKVKSNVNISNVQLDFTTYAGRTSFHSYGTTTSATLSIKKIVESK